MASPSAASSKGPVAVYTDDLCERWEVWAEDMTRALASGRPLPPPPRAAGKVVREVGRVAEAALTALAALWNVDVENRKLRKRNFELECALKAGDEETYRISECGAALADTVFWERQAITQLHEREGALGGKVAQVRVEAHRLREKETELEAEKLALESEVKRARENDKALRATNQELAQSGRELRAKLQDMTTQLSSKTAELRSAKEQERQMQEQLKAVEERTSRRVEQIENAHAESTSKEHQLREQLQKAEVDHHEVFDTLRRLVSDTEGHQAVGGLPLATASPAGNHTHESRPLERLPQSSGRIARGVLDGADHEAQHEAARAQPKPSSLLRQQAASRELLSPPGSHSQSGRVLVAGVAPLIREARSQDNYQQSPLRRGLN